MLEDIYDACTMIIVALVLAYPFQQAHGQDIPSACYLYADYAIVARAMANESVNEPVAKRVLASIYNIPPVHRSNFDLLFAMAQKDRRTPGDFATAIGNQCVAAAGRPQAFLGVGI